MKVVSLVPSITETLIRCGVEVVARTRYCIHPAAAVADIAVVGGTKGVNWERCAKLKPDLVIFDREENRLQMAEECPYPWHATHITSVDTVGPELARLATLLGNDKLAAMAVQWSELAALPARPRGSWLQLPAVQHWLGEVPETVTRLEYIIWRDPWMAVGLQTFIGSMLTKLGYADLLSPHAQAYPQLDDTQLRGTGTFCLFSSEPYPFGRHADVLRASGYHGAIVDGEAFSWFGIRSYRFLRAQLIPE